jgi:hypothetical protein
MDALTNILIDISIFAVLGLAYYLYQKRRIVQYSKMERAIALDDLIETAATFNAPNRPILNDFLNRMMDMKENNSLHFTQEDLDKVITENNDIPDWEEKLNYYRAALIKHSSSSSRTNK